MKVETLRNGDDRHFLYIICRLINGQLSQPIKIGVTSKPVVRLRELQTGSPHKLVIVHSFQCLDRESALACEKHLHDHWRSARQEGEWFHVNPIFCVVAAALSLRAEIKGDVISSTVQRLAGVAA